ncbi:hypothetical protein KMAL_00210 [Novacetimonas maltaceti]|uniref:Uncharacterized protein n=1 Tax=Novacetimonas maltaceti TaxID=1203393 RepID=A0A2S3W5P1_9PROT|nr:hypothetical protein KMAL_00210 [Novacetimonas maltaceti]
MSGKVNMPNDTASGREGIRKTPPGLTLMAFPKPVSLPVGLPQWERATPRSWILKISGLSGWMIPIDLCP